MSTELCTSLPTCLSSSVRRSSGSFVTDILLFFSGTEKEQREKILLEKTVKKKLTRFRPCINITAYVVRQEQENGTAQQILRKEVTVMFNTMKFRESAGIGIQVNKAIREITSAGREEDLRRLW